MRIVPVPVLALFFVVALTGCSSGLGGLTSPFAAPPSPVSSTPTGQVAGTTPPPVTSPTPSNDPTVAAIQAVIQKADQEQQDAFTKNDPTIMQDTSTSSYYKELVQTNNDMAKGGVSAIKFVKIEWGEVKLTGQGTAQASAYETWQTTYSDGSSDQARELNVYTLVQDQGAWKVQSDEHPNSGSGNSGGAPATGPPGSTSPRSPTAVVPTAVVTPAPGADTSRNWAGYASTSGKYTAVTGTWTVPKTINAGSPGADATWVGIGGVNSRDLIQAGTEESTSRDGTIQWDAWIEMLPRPSQQVRLAVKAGDSVTVSISQQSTGQWLVQMKNNTTGESYETTVRYQSSLSSAEWIEEAPSAGGRGGRILPLDNFGTVQFSDGTADQNGKPVTIEQTGAQPITLTDGRGNALVVPSKLTGDGKGFTVSRSGSAPTP